MASYRHAELMLMSKAVELDMLVCADLCSEMRRAHSAHAMARYPDTRYTTWNYYAALETQLMQVIGVRTDNSLDRREKR